MKASFNLTVADFKIWVHLGCGEEEKFHPQLVSVNIAFDFAAPPPAITTDDLEDTVCYAETTKAIQTLCQNKRFNLIESLAYDIHKAASQMLGNKVSLISCIKVSLHKISPPVPGIHGGVYAVYAAAPAC